MIYTIKQKLPPKWSVPALVGNNRVYYYLPDLEMDFTSCSQRKLAFEMTQEQSFSFGLRPQKNQPCVFLVVGAEESWGTPQTIYRKQSLLEKSTPNIFCEVNHFRIWTVCWFIHGVIWSNLFSVKEISRTKDTESSLTRLGSPEIGVCFYPNKFNKTQKFLVNL